jgi:hypothetical protein
MASAALAKHRARIHRFQTAQKTQAGERHVVVAAAAAALGWAEHGGHLPVSVLSVPTKLALGVGATLLAMNSRGSTQRVANAVADASLACYAYAATKAGAFIAGDDDEV